MTILFRYGEDGAFSVGNTDTRQVGWAHPESNAARAAALALSDTAEWFARKLSARGSFCLNSRSIEERILEKDEAFFWQALEKGRADRSTVDLDQWRSQIESEGLAEQRARQSDRDRAGDASPRSQSHAPAADMLAEARAELAAKHARETPQERVTRLCNERDERERLENERERGL
jgi:hypothetical protein